MTEDNEDPLKKLYLNTEEMDRERLADVLKGRIGIDEETGDPYFMGEFSKLNNKQKIVTYLLYRKAAVALNKIDGDKEGVKSQIISDEIGVKYDSVRSWLSKMDYIEKNGDKEGYYIPGYAMNEAIEVLPDDE